MSCNVSNFVIWYQTFRIIVTVCLVLAERKETTPLRTKLLHKNHGELCNRL